MIAGKAKLAASFSAQPAQPALTAWDSWALSEGQRLCPQEGKSVLSFALGSEMSSMQRF